ncbi:hypothetical protein, partial [Bradyrhizobium sp. 23]|uniref:hypothetical protein n=1 Tax=Bradyrhizobium sp. 23 TaxID=2782667 RepID=UPI001FFA3581
LPKCTSLSLQISQNHTPYFGGCNPRELSHPSMWPAISASGLASQINRCIAFAREQGRRVG